ncbi:hypothetical protein ABT115_08840 [Streptomyces sp. NPDC001832]|uniref:hypothetical protein n=1 Tax=Streptomyces sp. NPDC001832 TaxID=3154527 RepID=UPI00332306A8
MSWRYDIFECPNEVDDHSTCEAWSAPPIDILWDDRWKDAYLKAESLPHAVVERRYMGDLGWNTTPHIVFEHIDGGGVCFYCRERRGSLCQTAEENRFVCDTCRAGLRRMVLQTARNLGTDPSQFTYVPIIETIDFC